MQDPYPGSSHVRDFLRRLEIDGIGVEPAHEEPSRAVHLTTDPTLDDTADRHRQHILMELEGGQRVKAIVDRLMDQGVPETEARHLVLQVRDASQRLRQIPELRDAIRGRYFAMMISGLALVFFGLGLTVFSYDSSRGTAIVFYGALSAGVLAFLRGGFGWMQYRDYGREGVLLPTWRIVLACCSLGYFPIALAVATSCHSVAVLEDLAGAVIVLTGIALAVLIVVDWFTSLGLLVFSSDTPQQRRQRRAAVILHLGTCAAIILIAVITILTVS